MNLIFRLIRIVIAALMGQRLGLLDTSEVRLRVWPSDLDFNLHMNNGRYFTVMDLGRIDLMIRIGAFLLVHPRCQPLHVAACFPSDFPRSVVMSGGKDDLLRDSI